MEEQGTWASRTQKHSEAGYGRPVDRGAWAAKTVKRPRQQPAHPQYANYWAPLTRKRHTIPHPAQPQYTNHWAPRTWKQHQQEHRPQRPTESSHPTQHVKGRTGDCPGPVKEQQPDGMSHRGVPPALSNHHLGQGGSGGYAGLEGIQLLRTALVRCAGRHAAGPGTDERRPGGRRRFGSPLPPREHVQNRGRASR